MFIKLKYKYETFMVLKIAVLDDKKKFSKIKSESQCSDCLIFLRHVAVYVMKETFDYIKENEFAK
jgi:hypothetical protein